MKRFATREAGLFGAATLALAVLVLTTCGGNNDTCYGSECYGYNGTYAGGYPYGYPAGGTTCTQGQLSCGGQCIDPYSHTQHCGGCGQACPSGVPCVNGTCGNGGCAEPFQTCGTSCVDIGISVDHCGRCGQRCLAGEFCIRGFCQRPYPPCNYFELYCNNACVDIRNNNSHCGACNEICDIGAGMMCQNGRCLCLPGFRLIEGKCRYLGCADPNNCFVGGCNGPSCGSPLPYTGAYYMPYVTPYAIPYYGYGSEEYYSYY